MFVAALNKSVHPEYLCVCLVVAHEHGKGCDPGLEEAAHNDDSAHENTEKC